MSINIESLELEIVSNSASAVSGIESLSQSLEKLKTATKGGLGLTSVAKQISSVSTAVNSINSATLGNLTGLVSAIQTLSGVKISTNIGKQLTSIATAIANLDVTEFKSKIDSMSKSLEPLAQQLKVVSGSMESFQKSSKIVSSSNNKTEKSNTKSGVSFLAFKSKIEMVITAFKKVSTTIYGFIEKSSDYIENVNLFTIAMGSYADEAKAYAETIGEVMGIDPGEWMYTQGIFQTLATGFGVAGDKASIMSKNLTQLGYDIASFYNIDIEESMEKLQSGLAGELEPLRRIGYDLSQAKLAETALALGIDKSVSSMNQGEKAMLRYYAIMTQVTNVQGDMARTLDQPANQIRVLKSQLAMLGREIGNVFIPLLQRLLPIGIAVTKVLREMVATIASWTGFEMSDTNTGVESLASGSDAAADALDGAAKAAKKLKSYTMGIDELNIISPNDDSVSEGASLGAFDIELPEYDFLSDVTNSQIDGIITKIKELVAPITELWESRVDWAKALDFEPLGEGFSNLSSKMKPVVDAIWDLNTWADKEIAFPIQGWFIEDAIPKALETIAQAFDAIGKFIRPVIDGIKELKPVFEPIISWVGDVVIAILDGLRDVFSKLSDVFVEKGDTIKGIFTGFGDIVTALWAILKPIVDVIIPFIKEQFSIIGTHIAEIVGNIIEIISGVINFVAGVFTGDWERAWDGIIKIFSGIWDAIKSVVKVTWELVKSATTTTWKAIKKFFEPIGQWFNEKVIQPIGNFFKGLWKSVSGFFVNLWEDIKGVWEAVATWFDTYVIQPIVNFFAPIVERISAFFEGCWLIIQAVWVVASTWFDEFVIQPIVEFFRGLRDKISGLFSELWAGIVEIWTAVSNWFNEWVIFPIELAFDYACEKIGGFFTDLWEGIKEVWKSVSTFFEENIIDPVKGAFERACEEIGKFFSTLWLLIRQGVATAMNGVISSIESVINWIVKGINKLVGGFDKVVQWAADVLGKNWGGISLIQEVSFSRITVPTYAEGGFPESGQAFIARENGIPEMVGSIGRRTAVANNDQIVESISVGVAEANSEQNMLLREQNTLLRALLEKDSGVYLDGRFLSDSVDKYKREQGRVLITGGAL